MPHSFMLSRWTGLALVLTTVLAGCGGGAGGSGSGEAAAQLGRPSAAKASSPAPARRPPVDPLLRSTNAAANQAVQLKCNQKFEAHARNYTLGYGDRMRQRRLTDICTNLAAIS